MPGLDYGTFLIELRSSWDVSLGDDDCAVGDALILKRSVPGGFEGSTVVTHRMANAIFSDDEAELVRTILRRLRIPENIFDGRFSY